MECAARALYAGVPAATVDALLQPLRTGSSSPPATPAPAAPSLPVPAGRSRQRKSRADFVASLLEQDAVVTGKELAVRIGVAERTANRLLKEARTLVVAAMAAENPKISTSEVAARFGGLQHRHADQLLRKVLSRP